MNSHYDVNKLQDIYAKLATIAAKIQSHVPDLKQFDVLTDHYNEQLHNYMSQFFKGEPQFQILCHDLYSKTVILSRVVHNTEMAITAKIYALKEYLALAEAALSKCIESKLPEAHQHVSNFFGIKTFSLTTILLNFKNNVVPTLNIMLEQMQACDAETHLKECVADCEDLVKKYKPEPPAPIVANGADLAEIAKLRRDNLLLSSSLTQNTRLIDLLHARIARLECEKQILSKQKKPPSPSSGEAFFQPASSAQPIQPPHPARCLVNS